MNTILSWLKEFLIVYLILTILMHLAAADQYKKYLRFFSGIILMLMLLSPVLRLLGGTDKMDALMSYEAFWEQLDRIGQDTQNMEFLQSSRYLKKYEEAAARDIMNQASDLELPVSQVIVSLNENYEIQKVTVWMNVSQEQERSRAEELLVQFLEDTYRLEESRIFING